MSIFWIKILLAVFAAHLCVFFFLYIKKRQSHHLLTSLTFGLLVLSFSCRIWATHISLFGHDLHVLLRIMAWISTTFVVILTVNSIKKGRTHRSAPTKEYS